MLEAKTTISIWNVSAEQMQLVAGKFPLCLWNLGKSVTTQSRRPQNNILYGAAPADGGMWMVQARISRGLWHKSQMLTVRPCKIWTVPAMNNDIPFADPASHFLRHTNTIVIIPRDPAVEGRGGGCAEINLNYEYLLRRELPPET